MPSAEDPLTGSPGRTEVLSDAVFAIAMTLLVLDLKARVRQLLRIVSVHRGHLDKSPSCLSSD
jgi:uncharacterized membrane protein